MGDKGTQEGGPGRAEIEKGGGLKRACRNRDGGSEALKIFLEEGQLREVEHVRIGLEHIHGTLERLHRRLRARRGGGERSVG